MRTARADGGSKPMSITLREHSLGVILANDTLSDALLSPEEARFLARQLIRLARKVEARNPGEPDAV